MSLVYLYQYKLPVQLSMTNHGAPNLSRPMYNYAVKIYKNTYNTIDFVVRNNDKKPVRLIDCKIMVLVQNVQTGQLVMEKQALVTDEIKGRAQLTITPSETENWLLGGYAYQVQLTLPGQRQEFLFQDVQNDTVGTFELLPAVGAELVPAQVITWDQFTPQIIDWDMQTTQWKSGALAAQSPVGNKTGFYSVALYMNKWKGTFRTEASLENLAPTDKSWFPVYLHDLTDLPIEPDQPAVQVFNFQLNAQWIRFLFTPHVENMGDVVKVMYKIT